MSGPRRPATCSFAAVGAAMLPVFANAAPLPSLACPAGSVIEQHDRRPRQPLITEYCRNFTTKLLEGPTRELRPDGTLASQGTYVMGQLDGEYRDYNARGEALFIHKYSQGRLVSSVLTVAGLQDMVRIGNESLKSGPLKSTLEMPDDHTVVQTTTMDAAFPHGVKHDQELLRKMMLGDPRICRMFTIDSPLRTSVSRYLDRDGKEVGRVVLTRKDCAQSAVPK